MSQLAMLKEKISRADPVSQFSRSHSRSLYNAKRHVVLRNRELSSIFCYRGAQPGSRSLCQANRSHFAPCGLQPSASETAASSVQNNGQGIPLLFFPLPPHQRPRHSHASLRHGIEGKASPETAAALTAEVQGSDPSPSGSRSGSEPLASGSEQLPPPSVTAVSPSSSSLRVPSASSPFPADRVPSPSPSPSPSSSSSFSRHHKSDVAENEGEEKGQIKVAAVAGDNNKASAAFATLLGYAVLLGSFVRSVPQIGGMIAARSAAGVSFSATAVQTACFTVNIAYNARLGYPLHSYGELVACTVQEAIVLVLICVFSRASPLIWAAAAAAIALPPLVLFNRRLVSDVHLGHLQTFTVVATAVGSRIPQALLIQRRRDAGVLSGTTCLLNCLGNLARLYSSAVVTKDGINMAASALHAFLNAILLVQVIVFRKPPRG